MNPGSSRLPKTLVLIASFALAIILIIFLPESGGAYLALLLMLATALFTLYWQPKKSIAAEKNEEQSRQLRQNLSALMQNSSDTCNEQFRELLDNLDQLQELLRCAITGLTASFQGLEHESTQQKNMVFDLVASVSNKSDGHTNSWQWNASITYAVTLSPEYYFEPFKDLFSGLWFLDEYKDLKVFFAPQSFNWSFRANRSRDVSLNRSLPGQTVALKQISRNFNASRGFSFGWKLTEGGLLSPSGDYSLSIESSWLDLEVDPVTKAQRRFSSIMDDVFFNNALINFGQDRSYSQRNNFNTRPNIPNIFNIKNYLDLKLGYSVDYSWRNDVVPGDLSKSAGWSNNINASMNFRLKALFDPLGILDPGKIFPEARRVFT